MYLSGLSSFGENKGQSKDRPGFLREESGPIAPKPDLQKFSKDYLSTIAATKAHAKPKVTPKPKPKIRPNLKKFSKEYLSDIAVTTPASRAQMAKLTHIRNKWQEEALKENLKDLNQKIKSARIYIDMLAQFTSLSNKDRKILHKWIVKHEKAIKHLRAGRKISKTTKKVKKAVKLLDKEIDFWKKITKEKVTGRQKEDYTVKSFFINEDVSKSQAKIKRQYSTYLALKKDIKKKLASIEGPSKKDALIIAIMLEARPERFVVVSTILEALQDSFKRVSKAGGEKKTPEQEAEQFLKEESDKASTLLEELNNKKKELEGSKSKAASPVKSVALDGFWGDLSENPLTTGIGDLLPWLVAGFLIYKIKTER